MSKSSLSADQTRHHVSEVMNKDLSFEEKPKQTLSIGEEYLDVENWHVTRIDQESDYWQAIESTDDSDGAFPVALQLDLQEIYSRRIVTRDSPVALHNAPLQGWANDPALQSQSRHCYLGTTISIHDEAYGTVCSVSNEPRVNPLSDDEAMFAELISRMLEHELQRERTATKIEHLDRFANVVSHDLRNPLNAAQARVDIERSNCESEHLEIVVDTLDRMETLITDLLTMARQGHNVEETETVSLESIVQGCWQSVQTDDATMEIVDDLRFKADPDRSKRLFENLFRNTIEHVGETLSMRVGPLSDDDGPYSRIRAQPCLRDRLIDRR